MNRLSKQKRNQLIATVLIIVMIITCLWLFLIRFQLDSLKALAANKKTAVAKLSQILDTKKNSAKIEADLGVARNELAALEADMAFGDYYSSMVNTIRKFKAPYRVDIPELKPGNSADVSLLPRFPYKQFTIYISGTANFYDLGKFVADFENEFPTSRILNLDLYRASTSGIDDKEKLAFKMDIVSLVKSAPPVTARKP